MKAINAYDTENGICIVEKINGKRKLTYIDDFKWYFYMNTTDINKYQEIINRYTRQGLIHKIIHSTKSNYSRVYAQKERGNYNLEAFREECYLREIPLYEYDLSKALRYMIDNNIEIEDNLEILYFDIETYDAIGNIEIGRDEILSWAACDNHDKKYVKYGDEEKILRSFIKTIQKYDIIAGWNSEEFDLPYIQARCEKYGIKYNWKSIIHLDMLQRAHKLFSHDATHIGLNNFKLDTVAKFFLGQEKTHLEGKKIHELYKEDINLLLKYNLNDATILRDLDSKLKIIPLMITQCKLTSSFLNKFYVGILLDNYILRQAKKENVRLLSKPCKLALDDMREIEVVGGYVKTPDKGLYGKIHICDFKSLYPSIIIGWNIGIDTLNLELSKNGNDAMIKFLNYREIEEISYFEWDEFLKKEKLRLDPNNEYIQTANNCFFSRMHTSFIAKIVQDFLSLRSKYKKIMNQYEFDTPEYNTAFANQIVFKELANSMFGITCEKASRYFNKLTSEGITWTGQFLNKKSTNITERLGCSVIYGDTDSLFVNGKDDFTEAIIEVNDILKKELIDEFGLMSYIIELEYEKRFNKFLLLEKKKYSGLLEMKDGKKVDVIYSKGTTDVQKSNTKFGRETYINAISLIFKDGTTDKSLIDYVIKIRDLLYNKKIPPEKLVKQVKISKDLKEYKVDSINRRLVSRLLSEKKILPIVKSAKKIGTRLDYVIIKKNGRNESCLLEELTSDVDFDYYWVKEIYAPIKRVLKVAYPNVDWDIYESEKLHPTLF